MKDTPVIGVVGAGQMGRGIAHVSARAGCEVHLMDASESQLAAAVPTIGKDLGRLVAKGKMTDTERDLALSRLHPESSLSGLTGCDYVIEAATENTELKLQIFREMDRTLPGGVILASNTS